MDRKIVWPGAVPLETDILGTNLNAMIGLGRLALDLLGTSTLVSGLACTAQSPATMSVNIGAGAIYALQNVDNTAYSSLAANTTDQIVKQGILKASDALSLTMAAPTTPGYSVIYLIQAAYSEPDTDTVVLPFYNASNPAVPYSGPSNTGASSATTRAGKVNVNAKAGVAAASPTAPATDAGFVPLYYVTIAYGATAINTGNIAVAPGAPFITNTLTALAPKASPAFTGTPTAPTPANGDSSTKLATTAFVQSALTSNGGFLVDTGAVNAMVATSSSPPASLTTGTQVNVMAANTNTGNVTFNFAGFGAIAVKNEGAQIKPGQIVAGGIYTLIYDAVQWQLLAAGLDTAATTAQAGIVALAANSDVVTGTDTTKAATSQGVARAVQSGGYNYAADTGTANTIAIALTPALTAYSAGLAVEVKMNATNTGATTINVNGLGAKTVQFNGAALTAGQLVAGQIYCLIYDGTNFQVSSPVALAVGRVQAAGELAPVGGTIIKGFNVSSVTFSGALVTVAYTNSITNPVPVVNGGDSSNGSSSQSAFWGSGSSNNSSGFSINFGVSGGGGSISKATFVTVGL